MDHPLEPPSSELIGIVVCVVLGALYSAMSASLSALGETRLRAAREGQGPLSKVALRLLNDTSAVQARLMAGSILCVALIAGMTAHWAYPLGGLSVSMLAVLCVSFAYGVVAEVVTMLTVRRASRLALFMFRWLRPLEWVVLPFAAPLSVLGRWTNRFFPARPEDDPEHVTEVEVEHLIEQGEAKGSIPEDHAELLKSVLEFKDTIAREVMVPRTNVEAIEIQTPLNTVYSLIVEKGHSRYPVYRDRVDQVEGILYIKDVFRVVQQGLADKMKLTDLIQRPAFFVPETQKIGILLKEMQARRVHLAVVVDEFGGTSGLVTLEDILEEIVGEIRDEHDKDEVPVQALSDGSFIADAGVSVDDLEEALGQTLPEINGGYDSLGGMLVDLAGKVPEKGQAIQFGDFSFIVRDADARHVTRVEIRRTLPLNQATNTAA